MFFRTDVVGTFNYTIPATLEAGNYTFIWYSEDSYEEIGRDTWQLKSYADCKVAGANGACSDCSGHGTCQAGVCSCDANFGWFDCSRGCLSETVLQSTEASFSSELSVPSGNSLI